MTDQPDTDFDEAPLLGLESAPNDLSRAPKPLLEMTDAELQQWHASLRNVTTNPQTLAAHLRAGAGGKKTKPQEEIGEDYE